MFIGLLNLFCSFLLVLFWQFNKAKQENYLSCCLHFGAEEDYSVAKNSADEKPKAPFRMPHPHIFASF